MKKYTTESYIEICKNLHNNKYDYTLVKYSRLKDNIKIICKEHGEFTQRAQTHLNGASCIRCYKDSRNKSHDEFINECENKHNGKYDYINTIFTGSKSIIDIVCRKHGEFKQTAYKHLIGQGCPKCSQDSNRITSENFIKRSSDLHNNRYDYSNSKYIDSSTKVDIICKKHGNFKQSPNNHMIHKKGCPKCNGGVKYNIDDFIQRSNKKHNNRYNYSKVIYIDSSSKIKIICDKHGEFEQTPTAHMRGQNCPKCSIDNSKITLDEFIKRSNIIHNNKYDYVKVNFLKTSCYVSIICDCGFNFLQKVKNHLHGNGCPKCCSKNISKSEVKWLDKLNIPEEYRHKNIKINNKNFYIDALDFKNNIIYEFYGDYWHGNPLKYNPNDINRNNKKTFRELYQSTMNRENILKENGYGIVSIWESEFKKQIKEYAY